MCMVCVHVPHTLIHSYSRTLIHPCTRYWMMGFERYNKFIKDLCFNRHWPMASVANAYLRRIAAAYKVTNPNPMFRLCKCVFVCMRRIFSTTPRWACLGIPALLLARNDSGSVRVTFVSQHCMVSTHSHHTLSLDTLTLTLNNRSMRLLFHGRDSQEHYLTLQGQHFGCGIHRGPGYCCG